ERQEGAGPREGPDFEARPSLTGLAAPVDARGVGDDETVGGQKESFGRWQTQFRQLLFRPTQRATRGVAKGVFVGLQAAAILGCEPGTRQAVRSGDIGEGALAIIDIVEKEPGL